MSSTEPVQGLVTHPRPQPYPFGPTSLADILTAGLAAHPDKLALIDGDRSWTWTQLDAAVSDVATGIAPRQAITWSVGNSAEAIIGALATFRAGGIWVGAASSDDLDRLAPHIGPVRVISSPKNIETGHHGPATIDPHELAVVMFTSGTSGRPKAVAHSQHNLLWPGLISVDVEPPVDGERIGTPLSLGIGNIVALGPLSALLRGSTSVVMTRTHAAGFAADVETFGVTRAFVVAAMLHDLVESSEVDPRQLRTLDRVIVGGSPADPALQQRFHDYFSVRPTLSYGLSEAPTGIVRESLDDPIGSRRGFRLPHVDIVVENDEILLYAATTGRWAGSWTPTLGYVGEADRTEALFIDGKLRTGDRGELDADGALRVTGRLSDMIIRGGANIDPTAIETALTNIGWVNKALCVGIDDERLGQQVGVLLVISPTTDIAATDELRETLRTETGQPIDQVAIVDELPRNAMGKLVRSWDPLLSKRD